MLTEKQIDQTMAELHDGIRSLDIWDALWLMGVQAKQAIDLAAENELLKDERKRLIENNTILSDALDRANAKLDAVRKWASNPVRIDDFGYQMAQESVLAIIDKDGEDA